MSSRREDLIRSVGQRSPIKNMADARVRRSGERAADIVAAKLAPIDEEARILDFGAASGRVAVPLASLLPKARIYCADVDEEAALLAAELLPARCSSIVSNENPPLPFPDRYFDAAYSVSVWSHFEPEHAMRWLAELRRLVRGRLVVTTAGAASLALLQSNSRWPGTIRVSPEYPLFRPYHPENYPGVTGNWGDTVTDPGYIRREWSRYFDVEEIVEGGMPSGQDIVVLHARD